MTVIFPVRVLLADHSEVLVETEEGMEALSDQCEEGGVDDDIECVDFVYPIVLTVYNTNNEVADVIEIDSDEALHYFVTAMDEDDLVSFKFPITIRLASGAEVTIHDNLELRTQIESAANNCDEDDDRFRR